MKVKNRHIIEKMIFLIVIFLPLYLTAPLLEASVSLIVERGMASYYFLFLVSLLLYACYSYSKIPPLFDLVKSIKERKASDLELKSFVYACFEYPDVLDFVFKKYKHLHITIYFFSKKVLFPFIILSVFSCFFISSNHAYQFVLMDYIKLILSVLISLSLSRTYLFYIYSISGKQLRWSWLLPSILKETKDSSIILFSETLMAIILFFCVLLGMVFVSGIGLIQTKLFANQYPMWANISFLYSVGLMIIFSLLGHYKTLSSQADKRLLEKRKNIIEILNKYETLEKTINLWINDIKSEFSTLKKELDDLDISCIHFELVIYFPFLLFILGAFIYFLASNPPKACEVPCIPDWSVFVIIFTLIFLSLYTLADISRKTMRRNDMVSVS